MLAEYTPILFIILLAVGILWIIWRLARRLFGGTAPRAEPTAAPYPDRDAPPRDVGVRPLAASSPTIPDAADVLALKAAIDNLARQVAALESRLAPDRPMTQAPDPAPARPLERAPAPAEAPPVLPDRR
jgi:hypothetical protein